MALEKRGKTWHYDFKIGGVRHRGSLKTTDWREAQSLESELRERVKKGELAASKETKALARLTFKDAAAPAHHARLGFYSATTLPEEYPQRP